MPTKNSKKSKKPNATPKEPQVVSNTTSLNATPKEPQPATTITGPNAISIALADIQNDYEVT